MSNRNPLNPRSLSVLVFVALCVVCSLTTAHAQVVPQEGAINTTRSNIKNTSRIADLKGQIAVLVARYAGAQFSANTQWQSFRVGESGEFNLGMLPAGRYALTVEIAQVEKAAPADRKLGSLEGNLEGFGFTITVNGATGGPIKQDVSLARAGGDAANAARINSLSDKINTVDADLSAKKRGPARYNEIISFESDGKTELKGGIVIQNIKKPA